MVRIGPTIRRVFQSQALRYTVLALALPTLLVAPGHAEMLLLHGHCDESTHFHRIARADLDEWHDDHAKQHPCEGPAYAESHEAEAAWAEADCDHETPILVLPLTKEHLSRPLRPSGSGSLGLNLTMSAAAAVLLAAPEDALTGGPPAATIPRADLATLGATATLLLRNHALLL